MSRDLTEGERAEIDALKALPDEEIDTHDIPETLSENWLLGRRSPAGHVPQQTVMIQLEPDIVAWFRAHASKGEFQAEISRVLRGYVDEASKR